HDALAELLRVELGLVARVFPNDRQAVAAGQKLVVQIVLGRAPNELIMLRAKAGASARDPHGPKPHSTELRRGLQPADADTLGGFQFRHAASLPRQAVQMKRAPFGAPA